ncbi:MAG TPA: 50S ribosomal protein L34e [Candidatus Altiarchaeales archaeon]|nr:50S ribosomal protein L34e [Candidatus Altiarchaeales archaeon]
MVEPKKRSRSVKKVKTRTPGGRTVTHYKAKKHSKNVCGRCSAVLKGVASGGPAEVRKTTRSAKGPAKPYSGVLCTKCLDELARYVTRIEATMVEGFEGLDLKRDLSLEKFLPRGWYAGLSRK